MNTRICFFLLLSFLFSGNVLVAQDGGCAGAERTVDSLLVLAKHYAVEKKFISSESYFKGAREWQDAYPACFAQSRIPEDEALKVVAPATYQKLIEEVLALHENNRYDDATERYKVAGAYFARYEVAATGLSHPAFEDFLFTYCKGSYVRHYTEKLVAEEKFIPALAMYCRMLDKGINPEDIKRPLYDLGKFMGAKDALAADARPAKETLMQYMAGRNDLRYFEMGYRFGRKSTN